MARCVDVVNILSPPRSSSGSRASGASPSSTFLSNHARVLLCIAEDPAARMRDLSDEAGITARAVYRIVDDRERGG